jgi:ATP-dependent DNA ligase
MKLPIQPPFAPMEALLVNEIPVGENWRYEPKWDGFRCLAFREERDVRLLSKSGQDLTRYFPEIAAAMLKLDCRWFVLDGEIAVPVEGRFSFDDLLQRIHPASSRVQKLAREHPALFIVFDILVDEQRRNLLSKPLQERRELLERFARDYLKNKEGLRLSPATAEIGVAKKWFETVGADLDGIIAKRADLPYRPGERTGMQKVKKQRTADCVVGGFRYATDSRAIGSLLLGLYNEDDLLDHVGFCSGLKAQERKSLKRTLEPLILPPGFTGRAPGGVSRWSTKRSMEWVPLKPKLVVEVGYDHFTGGRFRHGTRLIRWRPDKSARQCRIDQIERKSKASVSLL